MVEFKTKSATYVISCARVLEDSDGLWLVTDKNVISSNANLAIPVVHWGHVYVVPKCTCSDWCSHFIWCPCIIQASTISNVLLESVENLHPPYILVLHPMWKESLKEANLEDYDDFPHLRFSNHSENTPMDNIRPMGEDQLHLLSTSNLTLTSEPFSVMPSTRYNQIGSNLLTS